MLDFYERLKEAEQISKEIGYIPVKENTSKKKVFYFSTGENIGNWIFFQKRRLKNNLMTAEEKEIFSEYLSKYSTFNIKYTEICKTAEELGRLPIIGTKNNNSRYIKKFSDGTDMGSWLSEYRKKLSENLLDDDKKEKIKTLICKYDLFNVKLKEASLIVEQLGFIPSVDKEKSNKTKIVKFSDGTDVGGWISVKTEEIKKGKLTDEQTKMFLEFYNKYRSLTFEEKIEELIKKVLEVNYYPIQSRADRLNKRSHYFSDGSDMGGFINCYKRKLKTGKMTDEELILFEQLLNINLGKISIWNNYYRELKKYNKENKNLNIYYLYKTTTGLDLGKFMFNEVIKTTIVPKTIIQKIHEEKISMIDPNWLSYYEEIINNEKKIQKIKKNN